MFVDYPDMAGLAALYSVLFLLAFLYWWFNTDSKDKLLEVLSSVTIIGAIFIAAGGTMLFIETMGPFTLAQTLFIVGIFMFTTSGIVILLLKREEK